MFFVRIPFRPFFALQREQLEGSELLILCFVETHVSQYAKPLEVKNRRVFSDPQMVEIVKPLESGGHPTQKILTFSFEKGFVSTFNDSFLSKLRSFVVCPLNFANYKNFQEARAANKLRRSLVTPWPFRFQASSATAFQLYYALSHVPLGVNETVHVSVKCSSNYIQRYI